MNAMIQTASVICNKCGRKYSLDVGEAKFEDDPATTNIECLCGNEFSMTIDNDVNDGLMLNLTPIIVK